MTKPHVLKARWLQEDETAINSAINALLQHEQGRKFLWWILELGKVHQQPFTGNALTTAFNCGEMNIGQQFLERVTRVSSVGYMNMMKEMADERTERDRQLDLGGDTSDESGDGNDRVDE